MNTLLHHAKLLLNDAFYCLLRGAQLFFFFSLQFFVLDILSSKIAKLRNYILNAYILRLFFKVKALIIFVKVARKLNIRKDCVRV